MRYLGTPGKAFLDVCQLGLNKIYQGNGLKLEEIARLAGVSKATASSVLNGNAEKYRISNKTQQRVKAIAHEHGYQPNHSAAALRSGMSQSIGFIVPDFENRSYLRIAKRLEALARKEGFQLIIASSDDDQATEVQTARMLVARGVDALLVSSCLNDDVSVYQNFLQQGTPVIALDRPLPDGFCSVISDDRQGARLLTESLDLKKIKHAALLGALPELDVSQLRERGFHDALAKHANIYGHCYYGKHYDAATGRATLSQAIKALGDMPDAIVTTSFNLLEGVIEALQNYPTGNLLTGENELQLATFGNSRLLDFLPIPVNSLPQQYERIADNAWQLARQAIGSTYQPKQVIINRILNRRTTS